MRVLILFFISLLVISEDYFPGEEWATASADEVGLDESKIEKLFDMKSYLRHYCNLIVKYQIQMFTILQL